MVLYCKLRRPPLSHKNEQSFLPDETSELDVACKHLEQLLGLKMETQRIVSEPHKTELDHNSSS